MTFRCEIADFSELASLLTQDEVSRMLDEVANHILVAALCVDDSGLLPMVRRELGERANAALSDCLSYAQKLLAQNELSQYECEYAQAEIVRLVNEEGVLLEVQ